MIKPIIYSSIEEKNRIEVEMQSSIPAERKLAVWKAITNFFSKDDSFRNRKLARSATLTSFLS